MHGCPLKFVKTYQTLESLSDDGGEPLLAGEVGDEEDVLGGRDLVGPANLMCKI